MEQLAVIVDVLVLQGKDEQALANRILHTVLNAFRIAAIVETERRLLQDVEQLLDFAQQQRTTVRTDGATVKISREDAATTRLNQIPLPVTGCREKVALYLLFKVLITQRLKVNITTFCNPWMRYSAQEFALSFLSDLASLT